MKISIKTKALILLSQTFLGCDQSIPIQDRTTIETVETTRDTVYIAMIDEDDIDPTLILSQREWKVPEGIESNWEQAVETSHSYSVQFDDIDASVAITFTTLNKDSANFFIKELRVYNLVQNKEYIIATNISDQVNMGTKQAFNTYVMVGLQGILKEGQRSTLKLTGDVVAAYAKSGTVEPL
ncbi:hypothetical protein GGR26_003625 [Lewinella marina]|nr:hypothetical protein [Neolewinella marina]NJB87838.1 hypothetical protein [Neolewinella marina]